MEDKFLYEFQEAPRPEFAKSLLARLSEQSASGPVPARSSFSLWRTPVLAPLSVLVVSAILLTFPSVRAAAQHFLDLFRIQRFAAVSINPARLQQLEQLREGKIDFQALLSRNIQVLKEPGKPIIVDDPRVAEQIAGIPVRLPNSLPNGITQAEIRVQDGGAVRFIADTAKLQELLDLLGIMDVQAPQQLNGTTVTVNIPPVVSALFAKGKTEIMLMQSRSPEISLPQGVYLPQIVEIVLRIAGLSSDEAQKFAYSIDWHSTLLVPVPADAASFHEVDVHGNTGLLIESNYSRGRNPSVLLWSEGGIVYALSGGIRSFELLEMANSL